MRHPSCLPKRPSHTTHYVGTSNRVDGDLDVLLLPGLAKTGLADSSPDDRTITVRTRLLEAGRRASERTSLGERYVVGLKGTLGAWDFDTALNHSVNTVSDRDVKGYLLYDKLMQGIASVWSVSREIPVRPGTRDL